MEQRVPRWAWAAAGASVAASIVVFAIGRGGTAVLLGVVLALAGLACVMLAERDRLPDSDD